MRCSPVTVLVCLLPAQNAELRGLITDPRRPLAREGSLAFTPTRKISVTLHANYGRGINSVDARGVVQRPDQTRLATTDFYQLGASANWRHVSFSVDCHRSHSCHTGLSGDRNRRHHSPLRRKVRASAPICY